MTTLAAIPRFCFLIRRLFRGEIEFLVNYLFLHPHKPHLAHGKRKPSGCATLAVLDDGKIGRDSQFFHSHVPKGNSHEPVVLEVVLRATHEQRLLLQSIKLFGVPFLSASRSKQELLHVNCSAHDSCSIDTSQRHVSVNSSDIEETLLNRAAEDSSSSASMQPRPKTSC